jgi:cytochrome c oxidase subunit 2
MHRRSIKPLLGLLAFAFTSTLQSFALAAPVDTGLGRPLDVSTEGHRSDWLFDVTAISVTVLFVLQFLIMFYALVKYRESTGSRADYDHGVGKKPLMVMGIVSSAIFVIVDGTLLWFSFKDVNGTWWNWPTQPDAVQVEVYAQQWAWNVRYAGADKKFGTEDDIVTLNDLRVPTGVPIHVKMKSSDVIHSFYLPNFRTKQDAVPGQMTQIWFQAKPEAATKWDEAKKAQVPAGGVQYDIGCAQHCGSNHYKMHGTLTVYTPAEYKDWFEAASKDAKRRYDSTDLASRWGWEWENK